MAESSPHETIDITPDRSSHASPEGEWAIPVPRLKVTNSTAGAINLNVDGRQVTNPLQGFGQLWQKTYQVRLSSAQVSPQEVVRVWKSRFSEFWPTGYYFYGPSDGIKAGEVALLNLAGPGGVTAPGGAPLISTGVLVIYSDDESFSFLTPEGHMFTGLITFSAAEEDGDVSVKIQAMVRASDPIYELSFRLGFGHKAEDDFWLQTLTNLALNFRVEAEPTQQVSLLDARVQWKQFANVRHNAAIRTGLYYLAAPLRWLGRLFGGKGMDRT
jgi:hypothetical protein